MRQRFSAAARQSGAPLLATAHCSRPLAKPDIGSLATPSTATSAASFATLAAPAATSTAPLAMVEAASAAPFAMASKPLLMEVTPCCIQVPKAPTTPGFSGAGFSAADGSGDGAAG